MGGKNVQGVFLTDIFLRWLWLFKSSHWDSRSQQQCILPILGSWLIAHSLGKRCVMLCSVVFPVLVCFGFYDAQNEVKSGDKRDS